MQERDSLRWLQLTYKVPSEPSQKRVWVWRRLQNLGAYALQNSVYLLPFSEEVEKQFRHLSHDIHEMGGEASVFSVVALDVADERRIMQALLDARTAEYNKVVKVCSRLLSKATRLADEQHWDEQVHAEFSEVLEKVHVLFRAARRHDVLGGYTASVRAIAAEALAVCEQVFRILLDREFAKVRRLLEMHTDLILPLSENDASLPEISASSESETIPPEKPERKKQQSSVASDEGKMLEPPI